MQMSGFTVRVSMLNSNQFNANTSLQLTDWSSVSSTHTHAHNWNTIAIVLTIIIILPQSPITISGPAITAAALQPVIERMSNDVIRMLSFV